MGDENTDTKTAPAPTTAKELLDTAEALMEKHGDNVSPEVDAEIDDLFNRAHAINTKAKRTSHLDTLRTALDQPVYTRPRTEQPVEKGKPVQAIVTKDAADQPWDSCGEQLLAIATHTMTNGQVADIRLKAAQGLSGTVPSDGGFLLQPEFSREIFQVAHETGILAPMTRKITLGANTNRFVMNGVAETSRATGSRWGGVRGYWVDEAATKTKSKPKFRQIELHPSKLVVLYYSTDELLNDATALQSITTQAVGEEIAFMTDDSIYEGDGAGKPQGFTNSGALITVSKETGQVAATIVSENIDKMYSRMFAKSVKNGVWFINQDCWPQLFSLSRDVGLGGVPVFIRPGLNINDAPFGTLMGRPVQVIEQASTVGTQNDIVFADMSFYLLVDKGSPKSDVSIHVQFLTDQSVFRFVYRLDGQSMLNSPITPFKGSATQSAFITLAVRS